MLSKLQKQKLVMVARKAYDAAVAARPSPPTEEAESKSKSKSKEQEFAEWRHAEVAKACGKAGLRCCENHDYPIVMAHFLKLGGEDGQALNWLLRAQSDGRRQAEAVLHREIIKAGLSLNYVEAICRTQFKCGVLDAGEKQLWSLVYTVRNRSRTKKDQNAEVKGQKVVPF